MWAAFTYFGNEVRDISKLFSKCYVKTAFRTRNALKNMSKPKNKMNKYESSGIYKLKCQTCHFYI
jgi:hypothetical protein